MCTGEPIVGAANYTPWDANKTYVINDTVLATCYSGHAFNLTSVTRVISCTSQGWEDSSPCYPGEANLDYNGFPWLSFLRTHTPLAGIPITAREISLFFKVWLRECRKFDYEMICSLWIHLTGQLLFSVFFSSIYSTLTLWLCHINLVLARSRRVWDIITRPCRSSVFLFIIVYWLSVPGGEAEAVFTLSRGVCVC